MLENASVPEPASPAPGAPVTALALVVLLEEAENTLSILVRLRQHRRTGRWQDLSLGEVRHFRRHVDVADGGFSRRGVLDRRRQVLLSEADSALRRAESAERRC